MSTQPNLESAKPLVGEIFSDELNIRRGIAPAQLIRNIEITAPFLFDGTQPPLRYLQVIQQVRDHVCVDLDHAEYFELCLSAHMATVATFVPTDVDNQIRFKLWDPKLTTEELEHMANLCLQMRRWDARPVSSRYVVSPMGVLSGHNGEWFSVAVGAFGALRKRSPKAADLVYGEIVDELNFHVAVLRHFWKAGDGVRLAEASTIVAHNLGDLDRVAEMWSLSSDDPKVAAIIGPTRDTQWPGHAFLGAAGELNRIRLAKENHRHFALRRPKCLRQSATLLLPIGPFFDDWGRRVATYGLSEREIGEVVEALVDGWVWLRKHAGEVTHGYARALSGILSGFPGGESVLIGTVPTKIAKQFRTGELRTLIAPAQSRFEESWNRIALKEYGAQLTRIQSANSGNMLLSCRKTPMH